jgi:hypothetical protein
MYFKESGPPTGDALKSGRVGGPEIWLADGLGNHLCPMDSTFIDGPCHNQVPIDEKVPQHAQDDAHQIHASDPMPVSAPSSLTHEVSIAEDRLLAVSGT